MLYVVVLLMVYVVVLLMVYVVVLLMVYVVVLLMVYVIVLSSVVKHKRLEKFMYSCDQCLHTIKQTPSKAVACSKGSAINGVCQFLRLIQRSIFL